MKTFVTHTPNFISFAHKGSLELSKYSNKQIYTYKCYYIICKRVLGAMIGIYNNPLPSDYFRYSAIVKYDNKRLPCIYFLSGKEFDHRQVTCEFSLSEIPRFFFCSYGDVVKADYC